jgi:cobalt-zinc-cadmium efflux system membrane fusion protein
MRTLRLVLLTALALSCTRSPSEKPQEAAATAAAVAAPAVGEMCQHRVLRAVCTKCNPRLIPVFQSKGDWCAEHGLPESFCPICHPERGGKPNHAVKDEKAPRDGLRVKFKRKDTAQAAGIEWSRVVERNQLTSIVAPASIAYDATRLAQVNARSPGVVRSLKVDVGAKVRKGEALLVIDSPDIGADRARLAAAQTRVELAQQNLDRQRKLVSEGISAQQNLLAAEQEVSAAKGESSALSASLSIMGAGGGGVGGYTLTAPLDGVVTDRRVTIGKRVNEEDVLLEIVDTRSMWADVAVSENDVPRVSAGDEVTLKFESLGARELKGRVSYVAPAVDPQTRTTKVRVPLENPDGTLRANLFGEASIAVSAARASVTVPRAAVQQAEGTSFVFVRISDTEFEVRRITLGDGDTQSVEVAKGLRAGEDVVTTGSFLLKTETSKESIGAGCCETD